MIKRRDLLKAGGATSALLGLGSLSRLLGFTTKSLNPSASHDFVFEFKSEDFLARSPQLQQALHDCMQYIVQETHGQILPVLSTDTPFT